MESAGACSAQFHTRKRQGELGIEIINRIVRYLCFLASGSLDCYWWTGKKRRGFCKNCYFFHDVLKQVTLYGSSHQNETSDVAGTAVDIEGSDEPAVVHAGGMTFRGSDRKKVRTLIFKIFDLRDVFFLL